MRGNESYALVDGGVYVNNPAMAAYAEACHVYGQAPKYLVVSVGTGNVQDHITYEQSKGWGLIGWARQIVPVLMDGVSEAVDYELECIRDCAYFRLQPEDLSPASGAMDDASSGNISALQDVGHAFVAKNVAQLNKIAAQLKPGRGADLSGIGN